MAHLARDRVSSRVGHRRTCSVPPLFVPPCAMPARATHHHHYNASTVPHSLRPQSVRTMRPGHLKRRPAAVRVTPVLASQDQCCVSRDVLSYASRSSRHRRRVQRWRCLGTSRQIAPARYGGHAEGGAPIMSRLEALCMSHHPRQGVEKWLPLDTWFLSCHCDH